MIWQSLPNGIEIYYIMEKYELDLPMQIGQSGKIRPGKKRREI